MKSRQEEREEYKKLVGMLMSPREFKEERKKILDSLTRVFQKKNKSLGFLEEGFVIPEEVRRAYFELFADSVHKISIQGWDFTDRSMIVNGRSSTISNFTLNYRPKIVSLEVSAYSFNGSKGIGIAEIGLFSTYRNLDGNLETDLRVGDRVEYDNGYGGSQDISEVIRKIQKSEVIPHISRKTLENLRGWKE